MMYIIFLMIDLVLDWNRLYKREHVMKTLGK
jgi:hypothetical protein